MSFIDAVIIFPSSLFDQFCDDIHDVAQFQKLLNCYHLNHIWRLFSAILCLQISCLPPTSNSKAPNMEASESIINSHS